MGNGTNKQIEQKSFYTIKQLVDDLHEAFDHYWEKDKVKHINNNDLIALVNGRREDYFRLIGALEVLPISDSVTAEIRNARELYMLLTKFVYALQGKD